MSILDCEIHCDSNAMHLEHVISGFVGLHHQEAIKLKQTICRPDPAKKRWTGLHVTMNKSIRLYYDTYDGPQVNEEVVGNVHCYFKRSFDGQSGCKWSNVYPLGLSCAVLSHHPSLLKLRRDLSFGTVRQRFAKLVRNLTSSEWPTTEALASHPKFHLPPRLIFMTRVYNPKTSLNQDDESLERLNVMRVECVRALRKAFGGVFMGGVASDGFSNKYCPDVVIKSAHWGNATSQYLSLLKQYPIGVATKGLWNSIGYKFAEYIAQSMAMISEPLDFQVPGGLQAGQNYLEFRTPSECVEVAGTLLEDSQLRRSMMLQNYRYYQLYLRPDSLVLNTLAIALQAQAQC